MAGWFNGSEVGGFRNQTGRAGRRMDSWAEEFKIRLDKRGGKEEGVLTFESRSSLFLRCKKGMKESRSMLIEQNARMALNLSHRAYVLETGRLTLEGPARDLMNHEHVKQAYLGGGRRSWREEKIKPDRP